MTWFVICTILAIFVDKTYTLRVREGITSLRMDSRLERTTCPPSLLPQSMPNATVSMRVNNVGERQVVYRCALGYVSSVVSPVPSREIAVGCTTSSGVTVADIAGASCVVGHCRLDPFLAMRHVTISSGSGGSIGADVSVNTVVNIACMSGYTVDGLATGPTVRQLTCDGDTLQLASSAEDCLPVSCGPVVVPHDAVQTSQSQRTVLYGNVVSFACLPGYVYQPTGLSTFSQICTSGGTMASSENPTGLILGECVILKCPNPPPSYAGADMVAMPTDTFPLFSQIQYVCHRGSNFLNITNVPQSLIPTRTSFRVSCIYDGLTAIYDTDPAIARCEAPLCPSPPILSSSSSLVRTTPEKDRYFVGDSVQYTCPFGGSPQEVHCTPDKEWTALDDSCVSMGCGALATALVPAHAAGVGWDLGAKLATNESVTAMCDAGYVSAQDDSDRVSVTCMSDGKYKGGQCVQRCGPLPTMPASTTARIVSTDGRNSTYVVGASISSVDTAIIRCNTGFSLDGEPVSTGGSNASQTLTCTNPTDSFPALRPCVLIVCGLPIQVVDARWTDTTKIRQYSYGDSVAYSCNEKFGILGSGGSVATEFTVKCSDYGWVVPPVKCEPVTCPTPVVSNGVILGDPSADFAAQVNLPIQCNSGFSASVDSITCGPLGTWLPLEPVCQAIACPELPPTLLGAHKSGSKHSLRFGDEAVSYLCDPAWNLPPIIVTCLPDRTYDVVGTECVEPQCTAALPTRMVNSVLMGGILTAPLNASAKVGCQPDYMTVDRSLEFSVECIGPGIWTNQRYTNGCPEKVPDPTLIDFR